MRKIIAILGGFGLVGSTAATVVSCDNSDNVVVLKDGTNTIIDTFKKSDVVDYYFEWWGEDMTQLVINFKDSGLKDYGQRYGYIRIYADQLEKALGFEADQEKYNVRPIPWV